MGVGRIFPRSSVTTPMGWARGLSSRQFSTIDCPLLPGFKISIVNDVDCHSDPWVFDQHPAQQAEAPLKDGIDRAEVLAFLRNEEREVVG